jgi:o-succinylbenzoate synthase
VPDEPQTYAIAVPTGFRGLTQRQGMVWRGSVGWAEWSPFLDYSGAELGNWLRAADEAAELGWPAPVRDAIPVNSTIPAVGPEQAYAMARAAGCRTAKVKVGEAGQSLTEDLARVAAVRDALGADGHVRVDANGAWSVADAEFAVTHLARFGLEYVEQPCRSVAELAALRVRLAQAGVDVPVAADESIRRVEDPLEVARCAAADVAVLKVQPLGGVRTALGIAERIGLPVVVSSALETSVGLRAGLALAAALPELPFACGLNTGPLLAGDLVANPLVAVDGVIRLREVAPDPGELDRHRADPATHAAWRTRLVQTRDLLAERGDG